MCPKRRDRSDSDPVSNPASHEEPKRRKLHANGGSPEPLKRAQAHLKGPHKHYSVGWICALSVELAAAKSMLDDFHESLNQDVHDSNTYTLGNIGSHNIVLACLPYGRTGLSNAAVVATNLRRSFPSITLILMVGIGGGVHGPHNPRLGDVVMGTEVIQYDLGKSHNGHFQLTDIVRRPLPDVLTAISSFRAGHDVDHNNRPNILRHMTQYTTPGSDLDVLFCSSCEPLSSTNCELCNELKHVRRKPRSTEPQIHYGKIASGSRVVKNAVERDMIAHELGVLCIDMEAAGVMDCYPCLSIRGLSDYSDVHKNDAWQAYAAGTAAACAKEFLSTMPYRRVSETAPASDSSQSSSRHPEQHAPPSQQTTHKITAHHMTVGDNARQILVCGVNGEVEASYLEGGNGTWQIIGSEGTMSILCNSEQPQNTGCLDDDDATTQLMDECISGSSRH